MTIAATNRPWDLDDAVLSRFDKKILIPLPDAGGRTDILRIHLLRQGFRVEPGMEELAKMTAGFAGRELEQVSREAINRMIYSENATLPELVDSGMEKVKDYTVKTRALTRADFEYALQRIQINTTPKEYEQYIKWQKEKAI